MLDFFLVTKSIISHRGGQGELLELHDLVIRILDKGDEHRTINGGLYFRSEG